jgi:thiamine kinase-like enzyme
MVTPLSGGLSNTSFKVTDQAGTYVARVGEDFPCHHVFRSREVVTSRAAHQAGLSPAVHHAETGVMVVDFIPGRTFGAEDVAADLMRCVEIVQRCHRDLGRRITGPAGMFWIFHVLRDYAVTLKEGRHRQVDILPRLMGIVDDMEAAQVPLPIVFGHHDLLAANFIDDGKRLWLIDWEYGNFGTAMFDLASLSSNNGLTPQLEHAMLEAYFGAPPSASLLRAFHAMKVAAALREALWGMVSEIHLNAPGVDYVAYAADYLGRFDTIHADFTRQFGKTAL